MVFFKFSVLLSYLGILYPSGILTKHIPISTNNSDSSDSASSDPIFHQPELWQFPDYALITFDNVTNVDQSELSKAQIDKDSKSGLPDMFDVMIGDQPRPASSSSPRDRQSEGARKKIKKLSETRRGLSSRSRYPKSKPCLSKQKKRSGKSVPFGTAPRFKQARDEMQALEVGYYGHRVELKCPFKKGCPKAKALWYKDGKELKGNEEKIVPQSHRLAIESD